MSSYERDMENGLEELFAVLRQDERVWGFIGRSFHADGMKMQLLGEIICGAQNGEHERLLELIYRYGSMLKGQDLLERQVFLWLQAIAADGVQGGQEL